MPVITDRILVRAIKTAAEKHNITCESFSDNWILRLSRGDETHLICGFGTDLNRQAATGVANDKVAAYMLLAERQLPAVPHFLLTSMAQPDLNKAQVKKLFSQFPELVIKRNRNGSTHLFARCRSVDDIQAFKTQHSYEESWAASPFIDIDYEIRVVVLEGEVILAYKKTDPHTVNGLPLFKLSLGTQAIAEAHLDSRLAKMATDAMNALGLSVGAVDIVIDQSGTAQILEVNTHFGLEHYALVSDEHRTAVMNFYERVLLKMFE